FIATDPDREGEAIAGHIVNVLGRNLASRCKRITYNEVSRKAIAAAMDNPRQVDWSLVRAQEGRRVLDRYVGYLVSPALTEQLRKLDSRLPWLSAGRVQSVALKLVVQRDLSIEQFVP